MYFIAFRVYLLRKTCKNPGRNKDSENKDLGRNRGWRTEYTPLRKLEKNADSAKFKPGWPSKKKITKKIKSKWQPIRRLRTMGREVMNSKIFEIV